MSWLQIIIYVLIALYILTVASVVFNVILENRNPVRTLAWIIVLVTVPLVGFLFYLYFGVNYRKNKMFSMKGLGDMKWLQYMSEDQKQLIRKSEFLKKRETVEVRKLMTLLLNNSKALLTRYNQVEILNNGEETFPALFGALKNAKKFIHLEYYIIGEGRLATELKEILLQKAAEGVEIRIIYDDVGSWSLSKEFIRELRKSDIQIYPFLPVRFHHLANKANYRNHRKIAVVDGEVGAVGFRLHAEQSPDDADNRCCVVVHEDVSRIVNVALEEMVHGDGNERRLASRDLRFTPDENEYNGCRLRLCLLRWRVHYVLPLGGQHVVRKGVVYGKRT